MNKSKNKQDEIINRLDMILAELKRIQTPNNITCPGIHLEPGKGVPLPSMPTWPAYPNPWNPNVTGPKPWDPPSIVTY